MLDKMKKRNKAEIDYEMPDDYSTEERITEVPEIYVYVGGVAVVLSIIGMFFGIPPFLIF